MKVVDFLEKQENIDRKSATQYNLIIYLIFLVLYFSGCDGYVPENWRKRFSLVRIEDGSCRIQTAAYTNKIGIIYVLATEVMEYRLQWYGNVAKIISQTREFGILNFKAYNAAYRSEYIYNVINRTDHVISLEVSRFTWKSRYLYIIKNRFLQQSILHGENKWGKFWQC